jgi:hypothetical protein
VDRFLLGTDLQEAMDLAVEEFNQILEEQKAEYEY